MASIEKLVELHLRYLVDLVKMKSVIVWLLLLNREYVSAINGYLPENRPKKAPDEFYIPQILRFD